MNRINAVLILIISTFWGFTFAQAPNYSNPEGDSMYMTSVEVAEAAAAFEELWDEGNDLLLLDQAQASILNGACAENWRDWVDSGREIIMLDRRRQRGEVLTPDEQTWGNTQKELRLTSKSDFDRCFSRQASRYDVLRRHRVSSNEGLVREYELILEGYAKQVNMAMRGDNPTLIRLMQAYPNIPDAETPRTKIQNTLDSMDQDKLKLLLDSHAIIAEFDGVFKGVQLRHEGRWEPAKKGQKIRIDDAIRTGPRGGARIRFLDRAARNNSGPTVVNIGHDSEIEVVKFQVSVFSKDETARFAVINLLEGVVRAFTKNWGSGSSFSIRTGTSLCGIRGTEVEVFYKPEIDEVVFKALSGIVEITPGKGNMFRLHPNFKVTVKDGRASPLQPLTKKPKPNA